MATISKWTPFGVALDITATAGTVKRTSATQFTVVISASWETYYNGASTKYGMTASSGGSSATLKTFSNTAASSGSGSFTGTYSISGNGAATKTITVTFRNFNDDNGDSATKTVSFNVSVPAWTSYSITYNANGGSGAPGSQTKWKDQTLTLSSTKPTRTGYSFLGWSTSSSATSATYSAGGSYTTNAAATLYAVWKANTYTVKYNANGGSGAPGNQTKTYGVALTLSSTKPTRTNYNFKGWGTSASATTVAYTAGASYTANAAVTLYAIWELAYTKPRVNNVSISRCTSNGTADDSGTYARVSFAWACDKTMSSITVVFEAEDSASKSYSISASGTSGTVNSVVGNGALDSETTYKVTLTVTDAVDHTSIFRTLGGTKFVVDYLAGGDGVAFGKPAELQGYMDAAFIALFRKPIFMGHYDDNEKAINFANDANRTGKTHAANGVYPHWCALYGGNGASAIAIGLYDIANGRPILTYNDVSNTIASGSIMRQPIIEAYPTTAYTVATANTWLKVALGATTLDPSIFTNYLSLSNGSIVCSRDGYIQCSAELYMENLTTGDNVGAAIYKDSTAMAYTFTSRSATNAYLSIPPKIMYVTAGQKISLYCRNVTGARGRTSAIAATTRLTVQYVG